MVTRFNRTVFPASSEFVALCQSQTAWLVRDLGAARSAVYLARAAESGDRLMPVVTYPETAQQESELLLALPGESELLPGVPRLGAGSALASEAVAARSEAAGETPPEPSDAPVEEESEDRQLVFPLLHEGAVLGVLVAGREDREWSDREFAHVERAANTLALACAIDQRRGRSEQQADELRHLQQQQRERLDDLLHQLRNPLAALRTLSKLFVKRLQGDDRDRDRALAESIVRESDRVEELVARVDEAIAAPPAAETPTLPPARSSYLLPGEGLTLESLDVTAVLVPLLDSATELARERGMRVVRDVPEALPPVRANASALREVLDNILSNALKYAGAGGTVDVRAGLVPLSGERLQGIAIGDDGPGIPEADRDRIFERRFRGVQATGEIPGSGLGLAIAKELTERMGGTIQVASPTVAVETDAPRGTTLVVWLPTAG